MTPEELTAQIVAALGDRLLDRRTRSDETIEFTVDADAFHDAAAAMLRAGLDRLEFLTAIDHKDRFDVVCQVYSFRDKLTARLRASIGRDGDTVPTVSDLWPVADWEEREVFDQFGIAFEGHPNMTRILNPDDWKGHPLRKDYEDPQVIKLPEYF